MDLRRLLKSFRWAWDGIAYAFATQQNIRIHFAAGALVLVGSYVFDVTRLELMVLLFAIFLVILAEMINTAIEATVDLHIDRYHELAKIAKNVAAGAVLVAALNAFVMGIVVFGPYLLQGLGR